MITNTINDNKTIMDGGKDVILAGRYHIIRQLGQGGMGSVWQAEDRQLDNRKVAIKMLPSIIVMDKRAYQQLKSEALVSLKLIHPNIVTLRAFEENNGAPFLVMDYIEGQTLSDYLAEKGKLSEAESIKLLKPIAAALDYAHGEKVIHRDVKPSNIIIRNDGHPFILDFGIAREIQESMTRVTGRTISGTLPYMSPEQLRGAPPTPAQDIYSFSVMLYECLTGNPPFVRGEIAYQILNETPRPLSNEFSMAVQVMKGLSKSPEDRVSTCLDLFMNCLFSKGDVFRDCKSKLTRTICLFLVGLVFALIFLLCLCLHVRNTKREVERPFDHSNIKGMVDYAQSSGDSRLTVETNLKCVVQEEITNVSDITQSPQNNERRPIDITMDSIPIKPIVQSTDHVQALRQASQGDSQMSETTNDSRSAVSDDAVGRTTTILAEIEAGLKKYQAITGALPSSLKELQTQMGVGCVSTLTDAWDTDIYYETDGTDFALQSAGPDRSFDTQKDNLIRISHSLFKNDMHDGTNYVDVMRKEQIGTQAKESPSSRRQSLGDNLADIMLEVKKVSFYELGKKYSLVDMNGELLKDENREFFSSQMPALIGSGVFGIKDFVSVTTRFTVESGIAYDIQLDTSLLKDRTEVEARYWQVIEEIKRQVPYQFTHNEVGTPFFFGSAKMVLPQGRELTVNTGLGENLVSLRLVDTNINALVMSGFEYHDENQLPDPSPFLGYRLRQDCRNVRGNWKFAQKSGDNKFYEFLPAIDQRIASHYVVRVDSDDRIDFLGCDSSFNNRVTANEKLSELMEKMQKVYKRKFYKRRPDPKSNFLVEWEMRFFAKKMKPFAENVEAKLLASILKNGSRYVVYLCLLRVDNLDIFESLDDRYRDAKPLQ